MAEPVFTVIPVSPANAKSRKPRSLYPCSSDSLSQNQSCMDRSLGSELSSTYARNSSTSKPKISQCINENEDYVGFTEISSRECSVKNGSHGNIDLNLGLDLTLWINHVESKHAVPQPNPPNLTGHSAILAGGMEQARIVTIRDSQAPVRSREDQNQNMYSDSRNMLDAVERFEGSYKEVSVAQSGPVQCSALGTLKENQQETPASSLNEAKHLPFSWITSKQFESFSTNHSGMDDLCNLSYDEGCQLSSCDLNLIDHSTAPEYSSITEDQVIGWPPIRLYRSNSLASLSVENRQEGAMAGSFVQGQGNSLYVKVSMDGVPIGRKVDMNAYGSYESLAQDLESMFQRTTENHLRAWTPLGSQHVVKPLRLLDPAADFVLTYEDSEGDCMLATDVPWKMFLHTVKRLRIMKNSGTNGFAQNCSKKRKTT